MFLKYLKSITGYTVAGLCVFIAMATFIANDQFGSSLIKVTGLNISPWYTGGDVIKTINHGSYQTHIHKPVFHGLFSDRKNGFVQIDWVTKTMLPDIIVEDIDFNEDAITDARLEYHINNKAALLNKKNPDVVAIERIFIRKNGVTVRIALRKS